MKTLALVCSLFVTWLASSDWLAAQTVADRGRPTPEQLQKMANRIDTQIAAFYRQKNLSVPEVVDDSTFLRRAFLTAVGRIPTIEEARDFLEIEAEGKRAMLAGYLFDSPGQSSHLTNWAFDLLRLTDQKIGTQANNAPYRDYVRRAIDADMPWDQLVTKLLGSHGDGWDPETAAVGYYTRDRGMPLDNIANSMRIFLGNRMECAQCHDDPFGVTERIDFYQLAAFTNDQHEKNRKFMQPLWDELADNQEEKREEYQVAQLLWDRVYGMSMEGRGNGRIALPSDWKAKRDGAPGELVGARTPFGKTVRISERRPADDGRMQLADWVVNRTGDQFSETIANRMWQRIMGKGVYEPVDDYVPAEKTLHPALMRELSAIMREVNYSLRDFQHVLMLTRTFQFATKPGGSEIEGGDDFNGRKIERLSAEQLWDSLITLSGGNPDLMPRRTLDERIHIGGRPVLVGKKSMVDLSNEVLALESEAAVRAYFADFLKQVKSGGGGGDGSMMSMRPQVIYNGDAMARASELPSPAPRSHFLYLFGQSDREVVDGFSREPNVGQVLSLMNGFVQKHLIYDAESYLYKNLRTSTYDDERIRRVYIAILSRVPTDDEMELMREELKERGDEGVRNMVSALVMSSEFLFLQ